MKIEFLVSTPLPKGGKIVWTCVKDHIIDEKEQYKSIGYVGLIINYLRKRTAAGLERD